MNFLTISYRGTVNKNATIILLIFYFYLLYSLIVAAIEMKFKNMHYPVIIATTHIQELNVVEKLDYGLRFGASVTLSTLEAALEDVIHDVEGKNYNNSTRWDRKNQPPALLWQIM